MCRRCLIFSRAMRAAPSAISLETIIGRRRNSRRTFFARAISGHSMRRACWASDRACSISRSSARRRRAEKSSWTSTAIRSPCPAIPSSASTGGALLAQPIDRLRKMNPLSIELYKRYKYDITREPLEFAINNQHMNGGLAVDTWGATSLEGCYAVGEAAGTHGVTRPGGAALNAGQVFGARCAEHVAARRKSYEPIDSEQALVDEAIGVILGSLRRGSSLKSDAIRKDVQDRMSDHASILCNAPD